MRIPKKSNIQKGEMMKKLIFIVALLLTVPAFAQEFPKVEVFGGYSLMRADIPVENAEIVQGDFYIDGIGYVTVSNMETSKLLNKGATGSFTYNITSAIGIEAAIRYNRGDLVNFDASVDGQTASGAIAMRDIAFAAGPKFTYRSSSPLRPFAHALVGFDDANFSVSGSFAGTSVNQDVESHTGFGLTLGGGLDVNVSKLIAIRLIQADYYMSKHFDDTQNNFAFSFGIVFGFGK